MPRWFNNDTTSTLHGHHGVLFAGTIKHFDVELEGIKEGRKIYIRPFYINSIFRRGVSRHHKHHHHKLSHRTSKSNFVGSFRGTRPNSITEPPALYYTDYGPAHWLMLRIHLTRTSFVVICHWTVVLPRRPNRFRADVQKYLTLCRHPLCRIVERNENFLRGRDLQPRSNFTTRRERGPETTANLPVIVYYLLSLARCPR